MAREHVNTYCAVWSRVYRYYKKTESWRFSSPKHPSAIDSAVRRMANNAQYGFFHTGLDYARWERYPERVLLRCT